MFIEPYLEPSQTSMMKLFAKIVLQKCSLVDVWLGSKNASGSLDAPCKMVPLNSFVLQYLCHNQFDFCFQKWQHYIEKQLTANFTRFTLICKHHFLIYVRSKSEVTKNIFNLQMTPKHTKLLTFIQVKPLMFIKHSLWE